MTVTIVSLTVVGSLRRCKPVTADQGRKVTDTFSLVQLITSEITKIPGRKVKTANGYMVCCPFHKDSTPSCSLNLNPNLVHKGRKIPVGYTYCFGCSEGKGPWNNLAERLGLRKLDGVQQEPTEFVKRESQSSLLEQDQSLPDLLESWSLVDDRLISSKEEWRGFSGKFLKRFNALDAVDENYGTRWLVFPVQIGDDVVGAIKARWHKRDGKASYLNSKGSWTRDQGLFPYDYVQRMKPRTVWLVEGPRDALRLLKYNIPALCILGTNNWSEAKRDLVLALGVERVVLMFDGDRAGVKITNLAYKMLKDEVDTKVVKLKRLARELELDKLDPCELEKKYLRQYVHQYHLS